VDAGYAYVVKAGDASVEEPGSDSGLFGDGKVAGSGADYGDMAARVGLGLLEGDGSGLWVMDRGWDCDKDGFGRGLIGSGGEDVGAGGGHAGEDFGYLRGALSSRVDNFGQAGAKAAVVIDAGVAEVFVGKVSEALGCGLWGEIAAFDRGQKFEKGGFVHCLLDCV